MILSPSLLSSDFGCLAEELQALEQAGLQWVHWDVMDGRFVPNLTFGPPVIKALRSRSRLFFDVHLMMVEPERYLDKFAEAGADLLVVHAEVSPHLPRTLTEIRRLGMKCGVALNPATPLESIEYVLPQADLVLLMSVNPGFGGQKFMPHTYKKLTRLREMIRAGDSAALIQVDGGVTPGNTPALLAAGADALVAGAAFFGFPPYAERLATFKDAAAGV